MYNRMKNLIISLFLIAFCLAAPLSGANASPTVELAVEKQQETITVTVDSVTPSKVFLVPQPDRLVMDVPVLKGRHSLSLPSGYRGRLVKNLRFGQFDTKTSRFVFDLAQPIKVLTINRIEKKNGSQLVVVVAPTGVSDSPEVKESEQRLRFPSQPKSPIAARNDPEKASPPLPELPKAQPEPELKEPKKNLAESKPAKPAKVSKQVKPLARPPGKPVIVIDPGHGGVDPGCIGPDGTQEKDITLAMAQTIKARLQKSGKYVVKLTRDDDRFIMLHKRVEIARRAGASLFISIHADSAPDQYARGVSLYTVSENASDRETAALANRENKSDVLAGIDLSDERDDVAGILISLAERDTMNRSATLADVLVTSLDDHVRLLPNSHRFAGFAVLKAPDVPSVLIETGFLSHPNEEKLLKSKAYREKIAAAVSNGVDGYFRSQSYLDNQ